MKYLYFSTGQESEQTKFKRIENEFPILEGKKQREKKGKDFGTTITATTLTSESSMETRKTSNIKSEVDRIKKSLDN